MGQAYFAFIISITFSPLVMAEMATSSSPPHIKPDPDPYWYASECNWTLSKLQERMIRDLEKKTESVRAIKSCLSVNKSSKFCDPTITEAISDLDKLEEHRQNKSSIDMQFRTGGGFELKTNSFALGTNEKGNLAIVTGGMTNGLGQKVKGLSENEAKEFWQRHEKDLTDYLNKEWWPKQTSKFPGWRDCLQTEHEQVQFQPDEMKYENKISRSTDWHLLFPRFVPKYNCTSLADRACRTAHQTCTNIFQFWSTAPYGHDYDRWRMRNSAMKDRGLQPGLKPWLYNVSGPVPKTRDEKMNTALSAYDKLNFQLEKLKKWISGLKGYELENLLEFDDGKDSFDVANCQEYKRKGVSSLFCEDHGHSLTGSRTVDECVAGFFMPANAALSLFKDLTNDQAFMAELRDRKEWEQKHEENLQSQMSSTMYAVPATVGGAAAATLAAQGAKKLIGRAARLIPYTPFVHPKLLKNIEFQNLVIYLEQKGVTKGQIADALRHAKYRCK